MNLRKGSWKPRFTADQSEGLVIGKIYGKRSILRNIVTNIFNHKNKEYLLSFQIKKGEGRERRREGGKKRRHIDTYSPKTHPQPYDLNNSNVRIT